MTHRIHVSVIAPSSYLEQFVAYEAPTIHYLAAQRVLTDVTYRRFYQMETEKGAYLILDNGVYDLGQSIDVQDLRKAAKLVGAREVVLPDVISDGRATISACRSAACEYRRSADSPRFCAVVQGATDGDWLECYEALCTAGYVEAIALPAPKSRRAMHGIAGNRLFAADYLARREMIIPQLTYRLLGLGDSGHLELSKQRSHKWIRSVDSSAPVVLGALGIEIRQGKPYRKVETRVEDIMHISERNCAVVYNNIRTIRSAAGW